MELMDDGWMMETRTRAPRGAVTIPIPCPPGATCVLRSKFSASHFWSDCRRYNVSVIQYVGELMRYLCNTPQVRPQTHPKPSLRGSVTLWSPRGVPVSPQRADDREHGVRMALGNGLRAEVWKEFQRRFGPVAIWEFYGATEGNAGFINYTGKVGAVGRANRFLKVSTALLGVTQGVTPWP